MSFWERWFEPKPFNSGYVPVSDMHKIYFHEYGNPKGRAIVCLHGGPGYYSRSSTAADFNLKKFRVILFDQRGCGKSVPAGETQQAAAFAQATSFAPAAQTSAASETAGTEEPKMEGNIVTSPLVGTFYAAPAEDAEPFVTVGSQVKKGQTLAIVEAMKLMNEIESDFDGKVAEVLVENGQPVEYGQPLFRIC